MYIFQSKAARTAAAVFLICANMAFPPYPILSRCIMMDKPLPPEDGACCENGCDPCVWDTYYAALRAWEMQQAAPDPTGNIGTPTSMPVCISTKPQP